MQCSVIALLVYYFAAPFYYWKILHFIAGNFETKNPTIPKKWWYQISYNFIPLLKLPVISARHLVTDIIKSVFTVSSFFYTYKKCLNFSNDNLSPKIPLHLASVDWQPDCDWLPHRLLYIVLLQPISFRHY